MELRSSLISTPRVFTRFQYEYMLSRLTLTASVIARVPITPDHSDYNDMRASLSVSYSAQKLHSNESPTIIEINPHQPRDRRSTSSSSSRHIAILLCFALAFFFVFPSFPSLSTYAIVFPALTQYSIFNTQPFYLLLIDLLPPLP